MLAHHRHSFRRLPGHHTSYAGLAVVMLLAGLLLASATRSAWALSGSISLSGSVPAPPPSAAPTIDSPVDGQTFSQANITVSGQCLSGLIVKVTKNNVFAGSAVCSAGSYSLTVTLFAGANALVARQYDNLNQSSPPSNTVNVTYNTAQPIQQLVLTSDDPYFSGYFPGQSVPLRLFVSGGTAPYQITVDWGDGNTDTVTRPSSGSFTLSHAYANPGSYIVTAAATDQSDQQAQLQLVAIINGQPAPTGTTGGEQPRGPGGFAGAARAVIQAVTQVTKALTQSVVELAKRTPPEVAKRVPYLLLLSLLAIVLMLAYQTYREIQLQRQLMALLKRQQTLAVEKDNFLQLTAHYLRTPLTIIKGGIELAGSLKKIPPDRLKPIQAATQTLGQRVESILSSLSGNAYLAGVKPPPPVTGKVRIWASPYFLFPVITIGAIITAANGLYVKIISLDLSVINLITQIVTYATLSVAMYLILRAFFIRRLATRRTNLLLGYEASLDGARNDFIRRGVAELSLDVDIIKTHAVDLPEGVDTKSIRDGSQRFAQMLAKFEWLEKIQVGVQTGIPVQQDLAHLASLAWAPLAEAAAKKKLAFTTTPGALPIITDQAMTTQVLGSILDNAVKFSPEGGQVKLEWQQTAEQTIITVSDQGKGLTAAQMAQLFKPFSRAESALVFNQEGLGFSLYLDKVMLWAMGGHIQITSKGGQGTKVSVMLPPVPPPAALKIQPAQAAAGLRPALAVPAAVLGVIVVLLIAVGNSGQRPLVDQILLVWPLYLLIGLVLLSFWMGERYEHHRLAT